MDELFGEVISKYTSEQGIEDGFLFRIADVKGFEKSPVNIITTNLMDKGYWKQYPDGKIELNIPNLKDLLVAIIKHCSKKQDYFYSLKIELPDGSKQQIYVAQNETGKYTAMLPEDN